MINQEDRKSMNTGVIQNLILENREKLSVSGVLDVLSFDDEVVIIQTELRNAYNKRWKFKNKQTKYWYFWSNCRRRNRKLSIFWKRRRKKKCKSSWKNIQINRGA